jgi:hypothetical protein
MSSAGASGDNSGGPGAKPPAQPDGGRPVPAVVALRMEDIAHWVVQRVAKRPVSPEARVARWARRPYAVGPRGNFAPLVLGPDEVPRIADLAESERSAELTVLSLLAHRRHADRAAFRAATAALVAEGGDRASLYFDLLHATFGQALTRAVEDLMLNGEPLSEWAKTHYRQGEAAGETKGEAVGKAKSVLAILSARGLAFSAEEQSVILASTDLERFDRWIARALSVGSVAELLSES